MALIIMGSSGGCCGRSGSALPDITMHAGAGARGASSVSATNIELGAHNRTGRHRSAGVRRRGHAIFCYYFLRKKKRENGPTLVLKR